MASNPGQFTSDEPFGELLQENYTLEAWVKPSHFHRGSFFGLIDWSPKNRNVSHHGLSLELCGPASPWFTDVDLTSLSADELRIPNYHPCSIRFLHRSPPARNAEKGTSCYTPQPYAPRTWQHVVATKAGDHMQLFVNGERVAEGREKTKSPDDMLVLIGQNWPLQFLDKPRDREFVGELEEVAIYNRALSADEILTHYNLVIHQEKPLAPQPEAKLSDLR